MKEEKLFDQGKQDSRKSYSQMCLKFYFIFIFIFTFAKMSSTTNITLVNLGIPELESLKQILNSTLLEIIIIIKWLGENLLKIIVIFQLKID